MTQCQLPRRLSRDTFIVFAWRDSKAQKLFLGNQQNTLNIFSEGTGLSQVSGKEIFTNKMKCMIVMKILTLRCY